MAKKKKKFPKGSVCKPCWELRYCPYGPLVEQFPLTGLNGEFDIDETKKNYDDAKNNIKKGKLKTDDEIWSEIDRIIYLDPSKWELLDEYLPTELSCKEWGHLCPVFWTQSGATETIIPRREGRYIPRAVMLKVVRRDSQHCQVCTKYVLDHETEFDHIIPVSKGGATSVENIRLLCRKCNREKSNSLDEILK